VISGSLDSPARIAAGYSFVRREQLQRYAVIQMDVRGRDVDGFVKEANAAIDKKIALPAGYWIEWGGAFANQQRALARLAIIVPITIFFIFVLLYTAFNSTRYALLIIANVPFATIGGLISLWLTGQYLSVPSAIGFIAVFGVAMLNGIVLISFINELRDKGASVADAVRQGAMLRLRPVMMTASVAILGLLPMLLSSGVGAETQRPLATVVIGGLLSEQYTYTVAKTPFLGDIPILGWLFKTRVKAMRKINLLVFLTPHIVRSPAEMEEQSIRKRRQFEERLGDDYLVSGERSEREQTLGQRSKNPVIVALGAHADRYPLDRMREIEEELQHKKAQADAEREAALYPDLYVVTAGRFHDQELATDRLTLLLDRGYEGTLVSGDSAGILIFELRVGPSASLREAENVAVVLVEAFGFDTSVMKLDQDRP